MRRSSPWRGIFDACYVLNLDRRTDRWAHVQRQLQRAHLDKFLKPGVRVTRVSGVDGAALDVAALHAQGVVTDLGFQRFQLPAEEKLFGMDLTPGAIGCALGHINIWRQIAASELPCKAALILEDDIEFHHRFDRLIAARWANVPSDWGIVYLGGLDLLASGKPPRPFLADGVRLAYQGHRELTAYVLHSASAKRCLELALPLTWQVDTHICSQLARDERAKDDFIADPKSYVFQPALAIQITSLGTDVQKRSADNPALEDAARRMREFVATHVHKVPSRPEVPGASTMPKTIHEPELPVDIYLTPPSRRASTSSHLPTQSLSRTTAQASDTPSPSSPSSSSASETGIRAAKLTLGGETCLEGGTFAPLLTKEGYKAVRVARGRSSPRTDRRRTRADLPPPPRRGSVHGDGELTVQMEVKGVDELRLKTTGLLARHVGPLPTAMMVATNPSLRTPPLCSSPKGVAGATTASRPSVYYASLPHPTLDDRITPQILHKLLKKDRLAAAFLMRATRGGDTPVSQSTAGDSQRGSGSKLTTVAHKLVLQHGTRPCIDGPTSIAVLNTNKGAAQAATNATTRGALPHANVELAETADDERAHTRAALRGDIRYLEPPGLTLANDAVYHGKEDTATVEGRSKAPHGLSARPEQHPPSEPCMHYPPVPRQYTSAAEEKLAKTLQRLAPLQPRRPHKLHPADQSALIVPAAGRRGGDATGGVPLTGHDEHTAGVVQEEDGEACRAAGALEQQQRQMLQFGFTSASRGEDVRLIERLVATYARRQTPCTDTTPQPPLTQAILAAYSQRRDERRDGVARQGEVDPLPFSALHAVLCVSKEYARVASHSATSPCDGQVAADAATVAEERQGVIRRLTHFDSTRVPEQYWVTTSHNGTQDNTRGTAGDVKDDVRRGMSRAEEGLVGGDAQSTNVLSAAVGDGTATSTRSGAENSTAIAAVSRQPNCGRAVGNPETTVFFPSACPTSRSQVYLLAEALDKMMACQPEALRALADPDIAFRILPQGATKEVTNEDESRLAEEAAVEENMAADGDPLLEAAVREASTAAYEHYTSAARWVIDILDTGLVELVRQVSAQCIERGALLDVLRQTVVDVAQGHMRVLAYAKRRAFEEATRRQRAERARQAAQAETQHALDRVRALEAEKALLERREADLTLKATRLDELLARVAAKRQRFELHSEDEHACLLHELEGEMTKTANEALGVIYDEKVRLLANADGADGGLLPRRGSIVEAPSAAEARKRAAQEKQAMVDLYTQSYQLLRTLNEAVAATDAACAPLYDAMVLKKVSPAANVAAARWATIARAVGAFEREKSHRQRVFQVFGEWCERYKKARRDRQQRQQDAQRDAAVDGDFLLESSLDERDNLDELLNDSAESFMELDPATGAPKERHDEVRHRRRGGTRSASEQRRLREESEAKRIQYITNADLLAMGVTDCTADEVNAMLARRFDFKSYLHFHWQPQTVEHTLTMVDLGQMVHDTQAILQEIVLRMQAMAQSAIMQKGCQPPLQPPAHPEDACVLCGRRDHVAEDKRKRQTTMQLIAQEVQRQMETLSEKCQKAESERQAARAQARQLRSDLDRAQEEVAGLQKQVNELMAYNASLGQNTLQVGRQRRATMRGPGAGHLPMVSTMGGSANSLAVQDMNGTMSSVNSTTRRRRQGGRSTPLQSTRRRDRRSSQDGHARRNSTSLSHPSMSAEQSGVRPPLVPRSPTEHEMVSGLNEGGTSTDMSEADVLEATTRDELHGP